nr:magnesium/cobalt transporter CorA [Bacteroidota bacterium]
MATEGNSKKLRATKKPSLKNAQNRKAAIGGVPGYFNIAADARPPVFRLYTYSNIEFQEFLPKNIGEAKAIMKANDGNVHWLEIHGFGDLQMFNDISNYFDIHPLELEDVINTYQRPKMEEHAGHLFIVTRGLFLNAEQSFINEQLSMFISNNFVITMQDSYEDLLESLRNRLRRGKSILRNSGSDFLMYSINDTVVDNYFPLLEKIGDRLDDLEEEALNDASRNTLTKIQTIKRELIVFRRTAFAERDKANDMLRSHNEIIREETKVYLRDTYDHVMQSLDLIDSYKEITTGLTDIYLSSISNRMNQIMKILAVISTIFIPLTFIVGVYGMNFASIDPLTNKPMPLNMPELYSPYGYVGVLILMAVMTISMIIYFARKGWMWKD